MPVGRGQVEAMITILGEDKITSLLSEVERQLEGSIDKTKRQGRATRKLKQSVSAMQSKWALFTVGLHAGLGLMRSAAAAAKSLAGSVEEAGKSIAIERRFQSVFENADATRRALSDAAMGQIDVTSLERWGAKAKTAGINASEMTRLMSLAVKAANATGRENVDVANSMLDSYVKGCLLYTSPSPRDS